MRILIPCFDTRGHHLHFAGLLCRAARDVGCQPVVALPAGGRECEQFRLFLGEERRVEAIEIFGANRPGSIALALQNAMSVNRLARTARCDRVWVHWADGIAVGRYLLGNRRWSVPAEALFLSGRYAYPRARRFSEAASSTMSFRAISSGIWHSTWHLDPLCAEFLKKQGLAVASMPEPVEPLDRLNRDEALRHLGLPGDRTIIGVLGSLDGRKGVLELLQAVKIASSSRLLIVLMGKIDALIAASVKELASRCPSGSVVVRDAVLSKRDFAAALWACDWQAVAYPRHVGSSGILVRAASIGRPVLASEFGWVGEATRRYSLGRTCDAASPTAIADQLVQIASDPLHVPTDAASSFARFNTEANFLAHWTGALRSELRMPADPALRRLD